MWGKHNEIRYRFREVYKAVSDGDMTLLGKVLIEQPRALKNMIFIEKRILFPTLLRKLSDYPLTDEYGSAYDAADRLRQYWRKVRNNAIKRHG